MDERLALVVVLALGAISCLCIGGVVFASASGHEAHPVLGYLATTALGTLAGLLVPPRPKAP